MAKCGSEYIFKSRAVTLDWVAIYRSPKMHEESKKLLASLDMFFDTKTSVKYLSTAQQQIVEICKLLNHKSRLIILDEPTASLSEREVKNLFIKINYFVIKD